MWKKENIKDITQSPFKYTQKDHINCDYSSLIFFQSDDDINQHFNYTIIKVKVMNAKKILTPLLWEEINIKIHVLQLNRKLISWYKWCQ